MNILKKIANHISLLFLVICSALALTTSQTFAQNCNNPTTIEEQIQCGTNNAAGGTAGNPESTLQRTITGIVNVLTFLVAAISVVMIIYGGYLFVTSSGDPSKVATAKRALIYALVGIAVAAAAQTITKFVITKL